MASFLYNTGAGKLVNGDIGFLTDTIKVGLATSGLTANRDDDFLDDGTANDFTSNELSGSGYTAGFGNAGRKTLASKTITIDKSNDRVAFDAADVVWSAISGGTAAYLEVFKEITNDGASIKISHHDFAVVTNGGDVTATITDLIRLSTV